MSMKNAIKSYCRYCQGLSEGSNLDAIRDCRAHSKAQNLDKIALEAAGGDCPLWPYRPGAGPVRKQKPMTDEQKTALVERLKAGKQATLGARS